MSMHALEMPKWGMTMEEGLVTSWLVSQGDEVTADQVVLEVESSKIAGEIPAGHDGIMARVVAEEGQELPVGALLGVVADAGTSDEDLDGFVIKHGPARTALDHEPEGASGGREPEPPLEEAPAPEPEPAAQRRAEARRARGGGGARSSAGGARSASSASASDPGSGTGPVTGTAPVSIPAELQGSDDAEVPATPHAAELAAQHRIALSHVEATGRDGRVTVADLQAAVEKAGGHLPFGNDRERETIVFSRRDDSQVPATPHARSLAEEQGINLHDARPTGTRGRVTVADVEAVLARRASMTQAPAASGIPDGLGAAPGATAAALNAATEIPMSRMRRIIGERLHDSYLDAPHFRVSVEARIDELLALRTQINGARRDAKVSVNDLVIAAVARTLVAVPGLNVQYDEDAQLIRQFEHADVSVAVSTPDGLITPIVTHADTRTITDISATMHDLGTRAKAGTLKPDEFQGGTFTVSNLGMFGVTGFDAIINPPQVAILAVGAATRRLVPGEDGSPRAVTVLPLTLSSDHRVVDGALAARFGNELVRVLQSPALIFA